MRRLDLQVAVRIEAAITQLASEEVGDVRYLQGSGGEWRLRVGDWRVRFAFLPIEGALEILQVLHRREAYRD